MRTPGIDISHYQKSWSGKVAPSAKFNFVIAKATEGSTYRDPKYWAFQTQFRPYEVSWGAYHVIRESSSVETQIANFIGHANLDFGEVAALDLETTHAKAIIQAFDDDRGKARHFLWQWLTGVARILRCVPILYTSLRGIKELTDDYKEPLDGLEVFPLWLAQYDAYLDLPPTHKDWFIWQYSSGGNAKSRGFASSEVDLNWLNGGIKRWAEVAARPRIIPLPDFPSPPARCQVCYRLLAQPVSLLCEECGK